MLIFLVTCSFSLTIMKLLFLWFWKNLSFFTIAKFLRTTLAPSSSPPTMPHKKKSSSSSSSFVSRAAGDANLEMSVLDLPDLVLESILEKLSPEELCRTANVCAALRDKCSSDHLWEKVMKSKWGEVVGPAAYRQWRSQMDSRKGSIFFERRNGGQLGYAALVDLWPLALIRSSFKRTHSFPPVDSVMSCYLALESGRFWFPAQVYNRENGHVGFMLSCYDAELSYDRKSDTFIARYLGHGTRPSTMESGVTWDRLRTPPVETSPHDLHDSDCLNELGPGDQMEIQWRRNREFPYGWWYGVVGHLETCDGNANYCRCRHSDTLVLEFNQYTRDSRWRRTLVNRQDHREKGNEVDGFYGGIRKLCRDKEISTWRKLWPTEVFE